MPWTVPDIHCEKPDDSLRSRRFETFYSPKDEVFRVDFRGLDGECMAFMLFEPDEYFGFAQAIRKDYHNQRRNHRRGRS